MPPSKSQIQQRLKSKGLKCYPLTSGVLYVESKGPSKTLKLIGAMFMIDGATFDSQDMFSARGAVVIGSTRIICTYDKYNPRPVKNLGSQPNESVANRLTLGAMIQDVLTNVIKPTCLVFTGGKTVTIPNTRSVKFLGKKAGDFSIKTKGSSLIPLSVNLPGGSYAEDLTSKEAVDFAHLMLETAAEDQVLNAGMDGNTMILQQPVAAKAPSNIVRNLFSEFHNGLMVVGKFNPQDISYSGRQNKITIKCDAVAVTATDLKTNMTPYLVITNTKGGRIGTLQGLGIQLIPKESVPKNATIIDI